VGALTDVGGVELVENALKRQAVSYGGDLLKERLGNAKKALVVF